MKREIKFRGKRVDNGEWIEGCIINNLWTKVNSGESVIEIVTGHPDIDCYGDLEFSGCFEVDHETVGQLTGLRDKSGVDIYEGDIMYYDFIPAHKEVSFLNGSFGVINKDNSFGNHNINNGIVIGNIHEHKHLLDASL